MPGRSTTTNLACRMNTASPTVCNRGMLAVVYFELSEAFDVVDRNLLLMKPLNSGVGGSHLQRVSSYKFRRETYCEGRAHFAETYSDSYGSPSGVHDMI